MMNETMGPSLDIKSFGDIGKGGSVAGPPLNDKAHYQTNLLPSATQRSGDTPPSMEGSHFAAGQSSSTPVVTGNPSTAGQSWG